MSRLPAVPRRRRAIAGAVAGLLAAATAAALTTSPLDAAAAAPVSKASSTPAAKPAPKTVKLQVLALNDFHGNLAPPSGSSGRIGTVEAGGAEYLSTKLSTLRAEADARGARSITVAAGDLIGASPLLSAAFHDEPTIEAMNDMGLEVSSVGNHEFDEGWRELVRMQRGGCLDDGDGANNQNSCPDHRFKGADFQYLSANVFHTDTGKTVFHGTYVKNVNGVKVGFIGMTLEATPTIVTASGVAGLRFADEIKTANKAATMLNRHGVKSIIVLLHEGGFPADPAAYDACPGISGPIVDINAGLTHRIDAIISGHTHQGYNCVLPDRGGYPRSVTSASSFGRLVTDYEFTLNKRTRDIIRPLTTVQNSIVTRDVTPDPVMTQLITHYQTLVADIANAVIGQLAPGTTVVSRTQDDSGESPLGNLIADAQRNDATLVANGGPIDVAFMNPGGIRADLVADASGNVTFGSAFSVQPFNNYDVSMTLTGQAIHDLLEQQWSGANAGGAAKVLQVSGLTYTWSASGAPGDRVDPADVLVNGVPLDLAGSYRVAENSFLADGGDNFAAFTTGTDKYFGGLDIDALAAYLTANSPYTPVATDRINVTP